MFKAKPVGKLKLYFMELDVASDSNLNMNESLCCIAMLVPCGSRPCIPGHTMTIVRDDRGLVRVFNAWTT